MEHITNYDNWKTNPEYDTVLCIRCEKEIIPRDHLKTARGYICEDCLEVEGEDGVL